MDLILLGGNFGKGGRGTASEPLLLLTLDFLSLPRLDVRVLGRAEVDRLRGRGVNEMM